MDRPTFLATLAGSLLAAPLAAHAQEAGRVYRLGVLGQGLPVTPEEVERSPFRQGLRELGWIPGRNLAIENRRSVGVQLLDDFAAQLVRLKVDAILALDVASTRAAMRATTSIPIVMVVGQDPVASALVSSLSRPGGNVTGLTSINSTLTVKRFELLKEVIPRLSRVALMWNPANPGNVTGVTEVTKLGPTMGARIQSLPVQGPDEFDRAFTAMGAERAEALWISSDAMLFVNRMRLAELAVRHRMPTVSTFREAAEAGALLVYGAVSDDLYRRAAGYVDRILKGAKPADLPVEQPTKFELVLNMKTAKALGLTIPPAVLARADQVIE